MHSEFLQQAVDLACINVAKQGGPFGAVIVKDRQLIAASGNRVTPDLDPTAHAEIMAIRQACRVLGDFQLKGCVLYTSCEPCPMCLGAIYWARLEAVYFACSHADAASAGFDDSFIYTEFGKPGIERSIPTLRVQLPEANRPFELWQAASDKIRY